MDQEDASLAPLRAAIVAAGARLGARRLIAAAEGNLSIRLPGDRLLVTPTGRRKDELAAGEMLVVPLAVSEPGDAGPAAHAGPRPSSDIAIHRAIYAARPDVTAVAHAHVPSSLGLTLAGAIPDPGALPETALLLPRLPFVAFGAMGSSELAGRIAAALAGAPEPLPGAVLLERHGAVAVGAGPGTAALGEAVDRLELIDVLCRAWRDALLLRRAAAPPEARY